MPTGGVGLYPRRAAARLHAVALAAHQLGMQSARHVAVITRGALRMASPG